MRGGSKLSISTGCQWSLHKCIEHTGGGKGRERSQGIKRAQQGPIPGSQDPLHQTTQGPVDSSPAMMAAGKLAKIPSIRVS